MDEADAVHRSLHDPDVVDPGDAAVPVTVEYALTPLGLTLNEAVAALTYWAERNMPAILKARQAFDVRKARVA
ncbi:MAG: hypothetical protein RLZZ200_1062 [Pseudomonadota bacterium]